MTVAPPGAPPVARRDRRRRRRGTATLVATIVLLVVAVACAGAAFVVRADTADVNARAAPIQRRVRELTASEHDAVRRLRALRAESRMTTTTLAALLAGFQAQVDASNHAVDVANQAVDQYNDGQAGLVAAFQAAGDPAMVDLEQRTTAVHTAVKAAQTTIGRLLASSG